MGVAQNTKQEEKRKMCSQNKGFSEREEEVTSNRRGTIRKDECARGNRRDITRWKQIKMVGERETKIKHKEKGGKVKGSKSGKRNRILNESLTTEEVETRSRVILNGSDNIWDFGEDQIPNQ